MPAPENVAALLAEVRHTLTTLSERGCTGFEVQADSLAKVMHWGQARQARGRADAGTASPDLDMVADLAAVRTALGDCQRCGLAQGRRNIVFGSGDAGARLVFVGEGPGRDEDASGEPFVGRAGDLLTKIIAAMHLNREAVYICNVVKCRPPNNRLPQHQEMAACLPFLHAQLRLIRPTVICTLGACASQALLETDLPISKLRGRFHPYPPGIGQPAGGSQVMPTFHPAYLLRHPEAKRAVWNDMQQIMKRLAAPASG